MGWRDDGTFETENWPFIEAANHGGRRSSTRLIVVHTPETSEMPDTAVCVARYFASGTTVWSTQLVVDGGDDPDPDHTIQCVYDSDIAHGAPGANHDGLHVEIAGTARQSVAEWDDDYSNRALDRAANAVAQWAIKYDIPLRHLNNNEVRASWDGLAGHVQISEVYKRSDHWDPGPNFPWAEFLERCHGWYRHWQSKHPGFQPEDDKPDFRVAVVANDDLSAGMGRVHGAFNQLAFLRWPHTGVTIGTAVITGGAPEWREKAVAEYEAQGVKVHVIAGEDRDRTAHLIADELKAGHRSADLAY